jgi:hypothetical protein
MRGQLARLEGMAGWLLRQGAQTQNTTRLEAFLPALEETARAIQLYAMELAEQRGTDTWPYWASGAHALILSDSKRVVKKVLEARAHLERNLWILVEKRLQDALLLAQEMRAALLEGPAPEMSETDIFLIQEAEAIAAAEWMRQNGLKR